ncbi:MAG: LAGLIDADG family homing endonuclease [Nanoarchaeota archaeon]
MNTKQRYQIRKFVNELAKIRGRHTELVSVYIPAGYDMNKIIQHLQQEQGTAENIKDKTTRMHVIDSLERMVRHLRLYKRTPENGLAIFAGNIAAQEGKSDIKVWSVEPPQELKFRSYRCDQTFMLDPLREMLEVREVYGLIVLDNREANIALLKGTFIEEVADMTSGVPGKARAGGQCENFGTLVQLADGDILKIEDCHNPHILKSAVLEDLSLNDSPIIDKCITNKKEMYKIITAYPQLVNEASKDHLFYVFTSDAIIEKPAEELKVGDYLLMPERIDIKGKVQKLNTNYYNFYHIKSQGLRYLKGIRLAKGLSQEKFQKIIGFHQAHISSIERGKENFRPLMLKRLCDRYGIDYKFFLKKYTEPSFYKEVRVKLHSILNPSLAQFLGYFIGDGNFEKDRITFSEQDKSVVLYYRNKFGNFFNLKPNYRFRRKKNYHQVRFTSRSLVRFIKEEFPEAKGLNQRIPPKILKSKDDVVAGFLGGLFDAEGYVSKNRAIGIASINKLLIGQLQLLLLRFSIISSFIEYDNKRNPYSKKHIFKLQINDKESILNFKKFIGFTSQKKTKYLNSLIKNKTDKTLIRQRLPAGLNVKKALKDYNCSLEPFRCSKFLNNKGMMSKKVFMKSILKKIKNKTLYNKLVRIYNSRLIPVKIDHIMVVKKPTRMVDIEVKNQNFIANGILVHNSSVRFARLREIAAHEFYKRIGEIANKEFLPKLKELKGILIGGPGPTKETFIDGAYLTNDLKKKVIAVKDISYTGESGLHDLVERSQDVLHEEEVTKEKQIMQEFFKLLAKESGKTAYGKEKVKEALEMGAVETLLLSESLSDEDIALFEELADKSGANIQMISVDTREGIQLRDLGGIAAILRFVIR